MERLNYLGLARCLKLSNGKIDLIAATEIGPRILYVGESGKEPCELNNVFGEFPDMAVKTEWGDWRPRAGHRLWVAPECMPHSYAPDDRPVDARSEGELSLRLVAPTDAAGYEKEMLVTLDQQNSAATVRHTITNRSSRTTEAAPWVLTIMREGEAIVPLEPHRDHGVALLPSQPLVIWPFTDLSDKRLRLTKTRIMLSSDPSCDAPQKIGLGCLGGWAAYRKPGVLFVKRFAHRPNERYPDFGSSVELFTRGPFLEVETLGTLMRLEPGESATHSEHWTLFFKSEAHELDTALKSL